jgi:alpha-N-arabinofuranosidase
MSYGKLRLEGLPKLDVVACVNETRTKLTVFAVNRSLENVTAQFVLTGAPFGRKARVYEITGEHIDSINSVFDPEKIKIVSRDLHAETDGWICELRASSIYALEFDLIS